MNPPPQRVVHLLAPARFGGLEKVVARLADAQARAGHGVVVVPVVTSRPEDHPFVRELAGSDAALHPLELPARAYVREIRRVREVVREARARILHTHGYREDILAPLIRRPLGVGAVSTVHGFTGGGMRNRFYERLQRRALRSFDAVVAVSQRLSEDLHASGVPADRLHVVRNALVPAPAPLARSEARRALGVEHEGPLLAWIGRMSPEKGPDVMLEALGRTANDDIHLSMLGDGAMASELVRLQQRLGLDGRVHWHGVVESAARLLPAFDALFLTSWTEGTPVTLLEAVAAGVPVVATAVGGVPEVLSPSEATLVEPGDVEALAGAADDVVGVGRDAAVARAAAARERLSAELGMESRVERYRSVYTLVTNGA